MIFFQIFQGYELFPVNTKEAFDTAAIECSYFLVVICFILFSSHENEK